jgi:mediator of RNA polymerase II transcription subunit 13
MPLTLLPYGTPAYYLKSYNGLMTQFTQSLFGLGCESWAALASKSSAPHTHTLGTNAGNHTMSRDLRFLIVWIDVQNNRICRGKISVIRSSGRSPCPFLFCPPQRRRMHLTGSPTSLAYHRSSSRRLRHPLRRCRHSRRYSCILSHHPTWTELSPSLMLWRTTP